MLTVRHYGSIDEEKVYEADEVWFYPNLPWDQKQIDDENMFEYGFADHSLFVRNAGTVVTLRKGTKTMYQIGKFYVMNENGKTVATYDMPFRGYR